MDSTNPSLPSFKVKRDEYLVEIRKNKNVEQLKMKRQKLVNQALNLEKEINLKEYPPLEEITKAFIEQYNIGELEGVTKQLKMIRDYLSLQDNPPVTELIATQTVPVILELMRKDYYHYESLIQECSWISCIIVSGDFDHTEYLISLGIIPKALELLDHTNIEIIENAIFTLGNICGESTKFRDEILNKGVVNHLDSLITRINGTQAEPSFWALVAWLISNLCRGPPYPDFPEIAILLPFIEYSLKSGETEELIYNCMWVLASLSNGDDSQIKEVLGMDIVEVLKNCLNSTNTKLLIPTLKTIGNILTGDDDDQSYEFLEKGFIEPLFILFEHKSEKIRKNVAWVFANIFAGSSEIVKLVVNFANGAIIDKLFELTLNDLPSIASECVFALTNAADNAELPELIELVNHQIIDLFLEICENREKIRGVKIVRACLNSLDRILEIGIDAVMGNPEESAFFQKFLNKGGMDILERMQGYKDNLSFEIIEKILNRFPNA